MKGAPSLSYGRDLVLVLKLYDKEEGLPIVSTFEASSELASRVYEKRLRVGYLESGQYWPDWFELCDFTDEEIEANVMKQIENNAFRVALKAAKDNFSEVLMNG